MTVPANTLSAGGSTTISVRCGYIHCQGSWQTNDFIKQVDDGGFVVCVVGRS